jgi:hypothetical protein
MRTISGDLESAVLLDEALHNLDEALHNKELGL